MSQTHHDSLRSAKLELAVSIISLTVCLSVIFSCAIWGLAWIVGQPIGDRPAGHLLPRVSLIDADSHSFDETRSIG